MKKLEGSMLTEKIRSRLILTDIEQNFFRGSIRIPADKQMNYHIFFSIGRYPELINLMQLRYYSLHASIDIQGMPKEFMSFGSAYRKGSIPDRLLQWLLYECKPGRLTYADITNETGLTTAQISQARSRHSDINDIFVAWQDPDDSNMFIKPKEPKKYTRQLNQKKD